MKFVILINDYTYNIEFHNINICDNKYDNIKYLFVISTNNLIKRFISEINLMDFKEFIKECIYHNNINNITKQKFDILFIDMLNEYKNVYHINMKICLLKKIGNLILFNHKYITYDNIKKFNIFIYKTSLENKLYTQIKYLFIMINNLINIKIKYNNINILDFIYDYYLE
jgi:hypothetical protein